MNEEEKKAVEFIRNLIVWDVRQYLCPNKEECKNLEIILNLIEKQQKQIEELNNIDEHFDNITPKEFDEKLEKYINAEYNKEFEDIFFDSELY